MEKPAMKPAIQAFIRQSHYQLLDTPLGCLRLVSDGKSITAIEFEGQHGGDGEDTRDPTLDMACRQLGEYFAGNRHQFSLPLAASGTAFQHRVWSALQAIPWGESRSYRDIAEQIGKPTAMRAVGAANGRNPIPIVVPCHRVIGSNGSLTGFAGGLPAKQTLLKLEGIELTA
jgi:methylated-DNA-[protein]-cysteine S-methyltransferase